MYPGPDSLRLDACAGGLGGGGVSGEDSEKGVIQRKGSSLLLRDLLFEVFECVPEGLLPGLLCPDLGTGPTHPSGAGQPKMFRCGLKRPITQPGDEVHEWGKRGQATFGATFRSLPGKRESSRPSASNTVAPPFSCLTKGSPWLNICPD